MKRTLLMIFLLACGPATPDSKTAAQQDRSAVACAGDPVAKESASPLASDLEGLPIARIEVAGHRLLTSSVIQAGSGLEIGKPLRRDDVTRAIHKLYEAGELDDIQVFVRQDGASSGGGVVVTLVVRERPRVAEIFAPGIPDGTKFEMAKWLGIEPGKPFDSAEVWIQRQQIAKGMAAKGATFDLKTHALKDNQIDVCILVK